MAKYFNTSVTCDPKRHYMVDTTAKMKVFERLIDQKAYFTINRARQFGKSSSLNWILWNMSDRYLVIPISFETEAEYNWQRGIEPVEVAAKYKLDMAFNAQEISTMLPRYVLLPEKQRVARASRMDCAQRQENLRGCDITHALLLN